MLGLSYGEIFLLLGATAAVIGPKDLPIVARTAGRLAGRAIGYVQLARAQFENVMQQSQARQFHKELRDTMAQLEAIRYEIRSVSVLNPGPLTRRLVDNLDTSSAANANSVPGIVDLESILDATVSKISIEQADGEHISMATIFKGSSLEASDPCIMHSQATAYARFAESSSLKANTFRSGADAEKLMDGVGLTYVLPVSAEGAGLFLKCKGNNLTISAYPSSHDVADDVTGSDIVLEAILEAEVAHNPGIFRTASKSIKTLTDSYCV